MKILFWVPYPTEGASNRYRVEQYLPYLKKAGIQYCLRPFWSSRAYRILYKKGHNFTKCYYFTLGTLSRLFDLTTVFRYDLIFIHREAYPVGGAFFEIILSLLRRFFIFDFDDAIFLPATSRSNNFIEKYKKPNKVAQIIKMSTHTIAGNRYLAYFAQRYNSCVSIIPTPLDMDKYHPHKKYHDAKVVIGWMGSVTTLRFLEMMKSVFIQLSKRFSHIEFKIVGGDFAIDGLSNIISKPWSLEQELEDLMSFDIGIMPMPDNDWTKGKCGFKAILYMSMGIPCVCSPVGVNKEIITDGANGFFVTTEDEWIKKLSALIEDRDLRRKIGEAARVKAEKEYSLLVNAPRFLEVIDRVYDAQ